MSVTQAAILTDDPPTPPEGVCGAMPAAAIAISGKPAAWWVMRELQRFGIDRFVFLTKRISGQLESVIRAAAPSLPRPAEIVFSAPPSDAGTAGALAHAAPLLDERFLLLGGARLLGANLAELVRDAVADAYPTLCRMLLREISDCSGHRTARLEGGRVIGFAGPAKAAVPGLVDTGVYLVDRRLLSRMPPSCSMENDVLPRLAVEGALRGSLERGWFVDVGVQADLECARGQLPRRLHRPALFLDRDGVLNVDHGYVGTRERWEWVDGAREAIAGATNRGWHVFVVTNQSGIARGFYDEPAMHALHAWVADEVRRSGGTIDDWRHCPFHPDGLTPQWAHESDWRKPAPGMILDLMRAWQPDMGRSLMVGDQPTDLQAAEAAGVAGLLFRGGRLDDFLRPFLSRASSASS